MILLNPSPLVCVAADIISSLAFKQDYESLSIEQCSDGGFKFKENAFLQVCAMQRPTCSLASALCVHCFEVGSLVQAAQKQNGCCCSLCLLCPPDQPCSVGRQAGCPVSLHAFEQDKSAPAVCLARICSASRHPWSRHLWQLPTP